MKKLILSTLFITALFYGKAQRCITDQVNQEIFNLNPELYHQHIESYQNIPQASNSKRATKYIIPVVFHVIHTNGVENISKAQILDQIRILNEDFTLTNPNRNNIRSIFQGAVANMEIEFRLATIDPVGNCTDGINRIYSSLGTNAPSRGANNPLAVQNIAGARWPNNMYLNVWVVASINSVGSGIGDIAGYAQFPSTSAGTTYNSTDGIVCRADCIGSIGTGNQPRTMTHEVGHYLGLLHPFTDSCKGSDSLDGDFCEDTPPVALYNTNSNCPANGNSCHNDFPDLIDQWENYMDYSRSSCQEMFTKQQKDIVYNTFEKYEFRKNMVSQANLIATGTATSSASTLAGFTASARIVCAGKPVTFTDISCKNTVTSRAWTLDGASTPTSTLAAPTVTYANPGFYKVSLTVNNSNTKTEDNYIQVLPAEAIDKYLIQTFENPNFQGDEGYTLSNDVGNFVRFARTTSAAFGGSASIVAPISAGNPSGLKYRIYTPKVDLSGYGGSAKFSFMAAYARPNNNTNGPNNTPIYETIRVFSSTDCGNTWTKRFDKTGTALFSTPNAALNFVPTDASQWREHVVTLPNSLQNDKNIMFFLEVEGAGGGPVYIDNINVSQFKTSTSSLTINKELNIFPVPAKNEINLNFEALEAGNSSIEITNALGQVVITQNSNTIAGEQILNIPFGNTLSSGIYFITLKTGNQVFMNKFIVE